RFRRRRSRTPSQQRRRKDMTKNPYSTLRLQSAVRASRAIQRDASLLKSLPELIDRETGIREVLEILENIIAEAGDLIESRSPELAAQARAALRRYADEAPRQAE